MRSPHPSTQENRQWWSVLERQKGKEKKKKKKGLLRILPTAVMLGGHVLAVALAAICGQIPILGSSIYNYGRMYAHTWAVCMSLRDGWMNE